MENLQGGTLALDHFYHLDERLRSFGLVTLYEATQDPFDHTVRVVVYDGLVDAGADPAVADRIGEAARRASKLPGEGLLSVVDFGEIEEGVPFVIEETVEGPSLTELMESRDVFSPAEVADLVDRLAGLLKKAHDQGVYHGNLQPGWIVFPDDQPNFETAQLSHVGIGPSIRELVGMSQTVLTTDLVEAFPPEAFDVATRDEDGQGMHLEEPDDQPGENPAHLSARADQWGLAALAYRLLVGVHPFFDDPVDASEGILRIKTEDPPSLAEMGVEDQISEVVDRALDHDPDNRWDSVTDFADAFREAVGGPAEATPNRASEQTEDPATAAGPDEAPDPGDLDDHRRGIEVEPRESTRAGQADEPTRPRPSGYLLTGALLALVLTNLGWFFVTMADRGDDAPADEDPGVHHQEADALPGGLQIRTRPEPADLWVVDPDDESEDALGSTPYTLTDPLAETSELNLALRHDDYPEQTVTIEETETGRDLILDLRTSPDEP